MGQNIPTMLPQHQPSLFYLHSHGQNYINIPMAIQQFPRLVLVCNEDATVNAFVMRLV